MKRDDWQQVFRAITLGTEIGLLMAANIGVGFFLGWVVDNYLGFDFALEILGAILGTASGIYSVYRLIIATIGDNN